MDDMKDIATFIKENKVRTTWVLTDVDILHIDFVCGLIDDIPTGMYNDELFVMYSKQKDRLRHG